MTIETWEEWWPAVEGAGLAFAPAEEPRRPRRPTQSPPQGAHAAEAAQALLLLLEEMRPHAAVSDILTVALVLAVSLPGAPRRPPHPHIYPVSSVDSPFF